MGNSSESPFWRSHIHIFEELSFGTWEKLDQQTETWSFPAIRNLRGEIHLSSEDDGDVLSDCSSSNTISNL